MLKFTSKLSIQEIDLSYLEESSLLEYEFYNACLQGAVEQVEKLLSKHKFLSEVVQEGLLTSLLYKHYDVASKIVSFGLSHVPLRCFFLLGTHHANEGGGAISPEISGIYTQLLPISVCSSDIVEGGSNYTAAQMLQEAIITKQDRTIDVLCRKKTPVGEIHFFAAGTHGQDGEALYMRLHAIYMQQHPTRERSGKTEVSSILGYRIVRARQAGSYRKALLNVLDTHAKDVRPYHMVLIGMLYGGEDKEFFSLINAAYKKACHALNKHRPYTCIPCDRERSKQFYNAIMRNDVGQIQKCVLQGCIVEWKHFFAAGISASKCGHTVACHNAGALIKLHEEQQPKRSSCLQKTAFPMYL